MINKAIDVSDNQGTIDWAKVKNAGICFAILRSIRGSGKTDYEFTNNVKGCIANNISFDVYKYSYATTVEQAKTEAEQVVKLLKENNIKCTVWWDMEDKTLRNLGKAVLTNLVKAAEEVITKAGFEFGVYCNLDWYKNVLDTKSLDNTYWIARYYAGDKTFAMSDDPNEQYKPSTNHSLFGWQYSSKGQVPGIKGNVDMNVLYGSEDKSEAVKTIKIGHACKDENSAYKNGKAGDQTEQEVCIRSWYNRPWSHIIRFKDPVMAEKAAVAMEHACSNNKIGYDQNQRNTLLKYAKEVGYDPGLVTDACETDCSALVALCCMYAGIPENILVNSGNSSITSNIRGQLMRTGKVDVYTQKKYLANGDCLKRGDILLYEGHHTAIALEDGKDADKTVIKPITPVTKNDCPYKEPTSTLKSGDTGEDVQWMKWHLNKIIAKGLIAATSLTESNKNWFAVTNTTFRAFQLAYPETGTNGKPDGKCGPKARAKMKSLV